MKVKLLKKCRKSIVILNNYFLPAEHNDKRLRVVVKNKFKLHSLINSWGGIYYSKTKAIEKQRAEILVLAHKLSTKTWYKICTLLG